MNSKDTDNIGEHEKNKNNKQHASQTTCLSTKETKHRLQIEHNNRLFLSNHYYGYVGNQIPVVSEVPGSVVFSVFPYTAFQ